MWGWHFSFCLFLGLPSRSILLEWALTVSIGIRPALVKRESTLILMAELEGIPTAKEYVLEGFQAHHFKELSEKEVSPKESNAKRQKQIPACLF